MRILFIAHNGYGYPHSRVRCYHFARILATMPDVETAVLSFREDLAPHRTEAAMYENLRDREKLWLTGKAIRRLLSSRDWTLYIQKAHFHTAAPFILHRLGLFKEYIFDYDDYDIPLSNFFGRGIWNRIFFGSHRWDDITRRIAGNARGCVCASHALLDLLQPWNTQLAYVPTGVDDRLFHPPDFRTNTGVITFFWNGLVWGEPILKNLTLMLRAYSYAFPEIPKTRLLIAGGGASWKQLEALIEREFSQLPIELRSWVDPQKMPELLRSVDVGLLPTEGDDLWLRSKSPTKLFEYMASALPVVASSVGEVTYVLEHMRSGYLARDVSEFAQGMIRLGKSETLRIEMGMQAHQKASAQYSLPVLGEDLYRFLKNTLR